MTTKLFTRSRALALAILVATTGYAHAATFTVTNTNNSGAGSLRQAILDANTAAGADIIAFDPAVFDSPQTITLASVITINAADNAALTITGPGADLLTVSGNNAVPIFIASASETVTVTGLRLAQANGSAISSSGALSVTNVTFDSNTAGNGGGISSTGSLTVTDCTFTNNKAISGSATGLGGGAIYHFGTTLAITGSTFTSNMETGGSGGGGAVRNRGGTATIANSTFINNSAVSGGGAVQNSQTMDLSDCTFTGNKTTTNGGAVSNTGGGQLTVARIAVSGNSAAVNGGGLYHQPNASTGAFVVVTDSSFANNTANSDNNTTGSGGGVYLTGTGSASIAGCTINGNTALGSPTGAGNGGGLDISTPTTLTNSTVSGNSAARQGGGIRATGVSTTIVTIDSSTIVGNTSAAGGGGINRATSSNPVNLRNTIIANNSDPASPDIAGAMTSQGYNLVENTTGGSLGGSDPATHITGIDPNLGPLSNNGGATQTHALLTGSAAIDKGHSGTLTTDQRGVLRPFDNSGIANAPGGDGADIGAFEAGAVDATLVVTNAADTGPGSLRAVLAEANSNGQIDTIVFEPVFFATPRTITLASELQITADGANPGRHVNIKGPGANLLTVSGNNAVRPFYVAENAAATISGITIRDGNGAGTVIEVPDAYGATNGGGAIAGRNCSLSLAGVVIRNNTLPAQYDVGGGIYLLRPASFSLLDSLVTENRAFHGAGIWIQTGAATVITNTTISNNFAEGLAGGAYVKLGTITMEDCLITGNTAGTNSAGLRLESLVGTITDVVVSTNTAGVLPNGTETRGTTAGVYSYAGAITFRRITVIDNEVPLRRTFPTGSLQIAAAQDQVIDSLIAGNRGEPGIRTSGSLPIHIINTTIANNRHEFLGTGGGIENTADELFVTNCTITGNVANIRGGGIHNFDDLPHVRNTIIAGNTSPEGPDVWGPSLSEGYNLVGNTSGSTGFGAAGDQLNVDPMLDPDGLQDNGGPTLTIALQPASPAIDKGHSSGSSTDGRGELRPSDFASIANAAGGDGADIGAFELQAPEPAPVAIISITKTASSVLLQGRGAPNTVYNIEATENLEQGFDPNPLGSATAGSDGNFEFTDTTNLPRRFYRAVSP